MATREQINANIDACSLAWGGIQGLINSELPAIQQQVAARKQLVRQRRKF